jgi:Mrp family chromosome partitioning ATPase
VLLTLYVLPAGPPPPDPAQLLGSSKMREMVESLLSQWRGDAGSASAPSSKMREMVKSLPSRFDYVVIDSPPVAAFADSLILSSLVEGVIIVVKGGATPREVAQRTKAHLQSVGANILGVVVNQIKLQPHDYYYYSNYSRYYYQDSDEESESDSKSMAAEAQGSEAAAPQEPSSPKRMNK